MSTTTSQAATVRVESAWEQDWIPLDYRRDDNVPGPVWKPLHTAEDGVMTYLIHLPPNWHDDVLDYHPAVEEGYNLSGTTTLGGEALTEGCYLYRPPGILHGPCAAPRDEGSTILQRMHGPIRILRYTGDEFPHEHKQPITDEWRDSPVEWTEKRDLEAFPYEDVTEGGWAGTRFRWVHTNRATGGGAALIELPAGWSGAGSSARGVVEEFVVKGELTAGGDRFGKWGYAYRPAGQPAGTYETKDGATLFCWWNGADER